MDKPISVKATAGCSDYCLNEACSSFQVQSNIMQLAEVSLFPNRSMRLVPSMASVNVSAGLCVVPALAYHTCILNL